MVVLVAGAVLWLAPSRYLPWDTTGFPDIDAASLSPEQVTVVDLLEQEHDRQRPGTFYSEGVRKPGAPTSSAGSCAKQGSR